MLGAGVEVRSKSKATSNDYNQKEPYLNSNSNEDVESRYQFEQVPDVFPIDLSHISKGYSPASAMSRDGIVSPPRRYVENPTSMKGNLNEMSQRYTHYSGQNQKNAGVKKAPE